MKIEYLGTGAAEGIPAMFCRCEYCNGVRKRGGKEIRSRSQILIDGELSIDFPPDSFYHAAQFGCDFSAIKYLIVTHSHMDHFYAADFVLRGYKYAANMTSPSLDVFGNAEVIEIFRESARREMREEVSKHIRLHAISAFEAVAFGGWRVAALKAKHSSEDPLVFLLEKDGKRILHLYDTALPPEEDYAFLSKLGGRAVDLVTFDCTFLWDEVSSNARHMGLRENQAVFDRLQEIGLADGHTKKVITHFSHNNRPELERLRRAEEEYGVIAAYDGMEIEI